MSDHAWADGADYDAPFPRLWRSLALRVGFSILAPSVWLSFVLLFLGFWAHDFSLVQNLLVLSVSVLFLFAALAMTWVSFGLSQARRWLDD